MKLENLKVQELNAQEMKSIEGGFSILRHVARMIGYAWDNRETVKKGPGDDAYYP